MTDKEIWAGLATDHLGIVTGDAMLENVHNTQDCRGRACVLHNPSNHHMRGWPTLFRADLGLMERTCQHGVGHPDPDDLAYHDSQGRDFSVHGCDGCCIPPPIADGHDYGIDDMKARGY